MNLKEGFSMYLTQTDLSASKVNRSKCRLMAILLLGLFVSINSVAQEENSSPSERVYRVDMTQKAMVEIVTELVDEYQGTPNNLQFTYNDVPMALISDEDNNRMRLFAPITSVDNLSNELLQAAMVSNFHLALDARYAIGNGILYATYIHPLKELTKEQIQSAVRQVSSLRSTFGSTFTSGELLYGGRNPEEQEI